jgi:hypothetical protein
VTALTYRDATGARHEVFVRETSAGDWQVLDTCARETVVIEALDGPADGEPQAAAVARDYVSNPARWVRATGPAAAEVIPEKGGADAHSDCRPRSGSRPPRARGAALPHPAG